MEKTVILLVSLTVTELFSLYQLKKYNVEGNNTDFIMGIIGYIITALLLTKLLAYEKIGIANHSWNVITSLCGFLIGYMYFNENLNRIEIFGGILSLIGVYLMLKF